MNLPSQLEIQSGWSISSPRVSIVCHAHNHEKFVADALRGFLLQITKFPFEIIIHDDASSDNTKEVIRSYQNCYPEIIKPIFQESNQYSRGLPPSYFTIRNVSSDYIAFCEGDDYWLDPYKLEKQVGFLERNPEYVISFHDAIVVDENNKKIADSFLGGRYRKDQSPEQMKEGEACILPLSWVFRNVLPPDIGWPHRGIVVNSDMFFLSLLGHFGAAKFQDEVSPGAYRRHPGGVWSMSSERDKRCNSTHTALTIARYYKVVGDLRLASIWQNGAEARFLKAVNTPDLENALRTRKGTLYSKRGEKVLLKRVGTIRLLKELMRRVFRYREERVS